MQSLKHRGSEIQLPPSPLPRRHGVGPVHSREVPLPLTRDYFEALENPKRASSPLRAKSRYIGMAGTGVASPTDFGTLCANVTFEKALFTKVAFSNNREPEHRLRTSRNKWHLPAPLWMSPLLLLPHNCQRN